MIAIGLLFVRMLYDFFKPRRRPNAKVVEGVARAAVGR